MIFHSITDTPKGAVDGLYLVFDCETDTYGIGHEDDYFGYDPTTLNAHWHVAWFGNPGAYVTHWVLLPQFEVSDDD